MQVKKKKRACRLPKLSPTYLSGRVDNLSRELLALVLDHFAERVLDGGIVALDEMAVDELDRQTGLPWSRLLAYAISRLSVSVRLHSAQPAKPTTRKKLRYPWAQHQNAHRNSHLANHWNSANAASRAEPQNREDAAEAEGRPDSSRYNTRRTVKPQHPTSSTMMSARRRPRVPSIPLPSITLAYPANREQQTNSGKVTYPQLCSPQSQSSSVWAPASFRP